VADAALFKVVLEQVAAIVHGLSGLDLEADAVRQLVNLAEDLLELLAREQIVKLAATHRYQKENVPHDDIQLLEEGA